MPLQQTSGNVTADAYGGGKAAIPNYIEDVFSTWLYTGNGSTQTITNGIDLAGKGGLVWIKDRTLTGTDHWWQNSANGFTNSLKSNSTSALVSGINIVSSVSSTGFTDAAGWPSGDGIVSWTFRKQPKFFDVVTWTGDGNPTRDIPHSLGVTPSCVIIKCTSTATDWVTTHVSATSTNYLYLNTTQSNSSANVVVNGQGYCWLAASDATNIHLQESDNGAIGNVNGGGRTYVAYLFAHNAGGFGLTGTDNVISCGSVTSTAGGTIPTVNLGFEPQWMLYKNTTSAWNWEIWDNMRVWNVASTGNATANSLRPNTSDAEISGSTAFTPTATGFFSNANFGASQTFIYIAIRRGPMKTPTSGTSVFSPFWQGGGSITNPITTGFPVDMTIATQTNSYSKWFFDRLRSNSTTAYATVTSTSTAAEITGSGAGISFQSNTGIVDQWIQDSRGVYWNFRRAPGFFDEVCYTGTGSDNRVINHNLSVTPELVIKKSRTSAASPDWHVQFTPASNLLLNSSRLDYQNGDTYLFSNFSSTSVTGGPSSGTYVNESGQNYVLYLFATCPGVSKCGSYTGNGSTQTINCGFTGGARFVLIKRTDAAGDWYVYDTARGMTTLTDPYLLLNSTAAESATLGSVTTVTTGFAVNASILAAINTNGASYIFLAIA